MDAEAMVGSMGLTFFCNKCVEAFYNFSNERQEQIPDDLREVCGKAVQAFKSLEWTPGSSDYPSDVGLFNTHHDVETFANAVRSGQGSDERGIIKKIVHQLESILDDNTPLEGKRKIAEEMQEFFDRLGDNSFYATQDFIETA